MLTLSGILKPGAFCFDSMYLVEWKQVWFFYKSISFWARCFFLVKLVCGLQKKMHCILKGHGQGRGHLEQLIKNQVERIMVQVMRHPLCKQWICLSVNIHSINILKMCRSRWTDGFLRSPLTASSESKWVCLGFTVRLFKLLSPVLIISIILFSCAIVSGCSPCSLFAPVCVWTSWLVGWNAVFGS